MPIQLNQNEKLIREVITKAKQRKSITSKLEIDDITNHFIELSDDKQAFMKKTIRDINKSTNKQKMSRNRDYFNSVNAYFKGKLFYIAFSSGKYLKIKSIEKHINKESILGMIKEIESGQEYAWDLIDSVENSEIHDFLYGIFSYIYY